MKHTQGPWKVEIHNGEPEIWNQNTYIASVRHDLFKTAKKPKQYEANARLIAAAPDLLAACEVIKDIAYAFNSDGAFNKEVELLTAAIKKAKGE